MRCRLQLGLVCVAMSACIIDKEHFLETECLLQNHCQLDSGGVAQCEQGYAWKDPGNPKNLVCCIAHDAAVCDQGDVYWANSCGIKEELKENCCDACSDGSCIITSNATYNCDGGDVYWFDSCGNKEGVKEACCDGCSGSACDAPVPHASQACDSGDVYWFDSCGARQELKEGCCGEGCNGATCNSPQPQASKGCYTNDLYWYDSCGNRGGLATSCCGEGCEGSICNPPLSHASFSCDSGDVYWFDSCGDREGIKENCCDGCAGDSCDAPTSHATTACDSGDVYYFDSCGNREELSQDCCATGCTDSNCDGLTDQASFACDSGDVYWFDSCGSRSDIKEDCCGEGCSASVCNSPTSHDSFACDSGDVYWFDSCGANEGLKDDCCDDACTGNTCDGPTSHMTFACDSDDVYWFDSCGTKEDEKENCCGQGCSDTTCNTPASHVSFDCDSGDVYWFDSCENRGDIKEDCCGEGCIGQVCSQNCGDGVWCVGAGEICDDGPTGSEWCSTTCKRIPSVVAGMSHTCALLETGALKCWGWDAQGQLGHGGPATDEFTPVPVQGLSSGVVAVTAGARHTCSLLDTGALKCWGWDSNGQLGDGGTNIDQNTPVDVVGLSSGVIGAAAGGYHTCALLGTGGVKCWGMDNVGQLGDGGAPSDQSTPVDVVGLSSGVAEVVAGGYYGCVLLETGAVKCWGADTGTNPDSTIPYTVPGLPSAVVAIAAGERHTCVVLDTGALKCWGYDGFGQLGDGGDIDQSTPVDVVGLSSGVIGAAADGYHTCALLGTGAVKCWGYDLYGQLGDGGDIDQSTPVDVVGLSSGVVDVEAGGVHTCAVLDTGAIQCWGYGGNGQLGDGGVGTGSTPVDVVGIP